MSKSHIEAFTKAQYEALTQTNKERIPFTIAGCKDGHLYDLSGRDFGEFNLDAPDTEFITVKDGELSRITKVKILAITNTMKKFFDTYGANPVEAAEQSDPGGGDKDKAEIDTEAVEEACKKAIKKGKFDKAQKLIDKLGGHKKLQKKLDMAQ